MKGLVFWRLLKKNLTWFTLYRKAYQSGRLELMQRRTFFEPLGNSIWRCSLWLELTSFRHGYTQLHVNKHRSSPTCSRDALKVTSAKNADPAIHNLQLVETRDDVASPFARFNCKDVTRNWLRRVQVDALSPLPLVISHMARYVPIWGYILSALEG